MEKELKSSAAQRRASLKWERENTEKVTIKIRSDGSQGVTKEAIQAAAAQAGQSVNAWVLEAIRKAL